MRFQHLLIKIKSFICSNDCELFPADFEREREKERERERERKKEREGKKGRERKKGRGGKGKKEINIGNNFFCLFLNKILISHNEFA